MIPIECVAQSYAWGKKGSQSLVAKLARSDFFCLYKNQ
ncbi:hypothetical protein EON65_03165 [archaeon]|nr:MAG: hypothetical protein EON65_03165 [archaeon]